MVIKTLRVDQEWCKITTLPIIMVLWQILKHVEMVEDSSVTNKKRHHQENFIYHNTGTRDGKESLDRILRILKCNPNHVTNPCIYTDLTSFWRQNVVKCKCLIPSHHQLIGGRNNFNTCTLSSQLLLGQQGANLCSNIAYKYYLKQC